MFGLYLRIFCAGKEGRGPFFGGQLVPLRGRGQEHDDANHQPADKHLDGYAAHVGGRVGDEKHHQQDGHGNRCKPCHGQTAGNLIGARKIRLGLTQADEAVGCHTPGQHIGCAAESGQGIDQAQTQEGADDRGHQTHDQTVDRGAGFGRTLGQNSGKHTGAGQSHAPPMVISRRE